MAFEGISSKLQGVFKKLTGRGKLSEKDVRDAMREIKLALLEADVNFLVVKDFVKTVTERAVGVEVLERLTPGQQVIKIVNEELTLLMGGTGSKLDFGSTKPAVILMAGLQGAGKTTMCGKLAGLMKKQYGKTPMLVACDIYRPAAIQQLQIVGEKVGVPVFERGQSDPVETAKLAIAKAQHDFCDVVLLDTAGRLHIDADMMEELRRIRDTVHPCEVLLVVDASDPHRALEVEAVRSVLREIGADGIRSVTVLNKSDLLDDDALREAQRSHPDAQVISALDGDGIRGLLYRIAREAASGSVTMSVLVPYEKGLLMKMVHERCQVMRETYVQEGLLATVKADPRMASTLEPYRVEDEASDPNPDLGPDLIGHERQRALEG